MRPRVLFAGRTRYRLPLDPSLRRKFDALGEEMDVRVLASAPTGAPTGDDVFVLVSPLRPRALDGALFYVALPVRVARELRRFRPDAVIAQSPFEAAAVLAARRLARSRARVVLEVHGDWRASTRLYGSRFRRVLGPLGDRIAAAALRRADAVRTLSPFTTELVRRCGVEPEASFPTYTDLTPFLERPPAPLPDRPQALFVGVLEPYKNVDGLAEAWRLAAPRVPGATLRIVGTGPRTAVVERLLADLPEQTSWTRVLSSPQVAEALDVATVLVLPSRSEGTPRVIIEALCRGRPVIGARVGGIPDLVSDGVNGLLVAPDDRRALSDALVRVLGDRTLAERLAAGALARAGEWLFTPEEYAARVRALVERVTAKP